MTPQANKKPVRLKKHNDVRIDNYYWLNQRENPEVVRYIEKENAYLKKVLDQTKPLRKKLFNEMKSRIKPDDTTLPDQKDDYFYYARFEKNRDYPIYCRRHLKSKEQIILDVNTLARGKKYFNVGAIRISPDHSMMSYAVDEVGRNFFELRIKNLKTNKMHPARIPMITQSHLWAADNQTLFFCKQDPETLRTHQVFRTTLDQPKKHHLVFEEKDEKFDVGLYQDKLKKFIFISCDSKTSSESRYILANQTVGKFKIFQKRQLRLEYSVDCDGSTFFIHTNYKAKNYKVMTCPLEKTEIKSWKTLIAHRKDVLLDGFELFKDYIALQEHKNGLPQIHIWSRLKKTSTMIPFPDPTFVASLHSINQYESEVMRYSYSSLRQPPSTYEFNMRLKKSKLLKQKEVLGGFNKKNYETKRFFAVAGDGAKIPISLIYKKGKPAKNRPLLLEGYGSYGITNSPSFFSEMVSLIDRGFIYAIAGIRGGSEMGRAWYENGKFLKKKNTFNDFITATEFLHKKKLSSPQHTYAVGKSAGGLLMGAIINLKPHLYNGIVMGVPFVDALTTMLDESLPLTTMEYEEWGNPNELKYYKYIKSYSPYDNLKSQAYPHLLITTGFHDSQVQYWEPAKYLAKLRDLKTDTNHQLMFTEMSAGHSGLTGRYQSLELDAMEIAFLLFLEQKGMSNNREVKKT